MGFFDWVGGLYKTVEGKISSAVHFIPHVFQVLWHLLQALGHNVGRAWGTLYGAMHTFGQLVDDLSRSVYLFGYRVLRVTIPNAIRNTLHLALSEAGKLANTVKQWAVSAYRASLSFASRIVADLRSWTSSAVHWLTGLIAEIRATLAFVAHVVHNLLTHPEQLVTWILPTLSRALLRLAFASAEAIARLVLTKAVPLILHAVPEIESVIADLL